jgi:cytochrome c5
LKRDQKPFDMYKLVLGVLTVAMLAILFTAMRNSGMSEDIFTDGSEEYMASVGERIKPFGNVYLPGEETAADRPQVAQVPTPEPVAAVQTGPQVFNAACIACHGSGIGGAPILADAENWAPRIAQGLDTLRVHAIDGYTGSAGYMPPKGARLDFSDQEVNAAVDYMLEQIPQ